MKKQSRKAAKSASTGRSRTRPLNRPNEDPKSTLAPEVSSTPRTPNIPELARQGGLDRASYAVPFALGEHKGRLYIEASGNSTATVTQCTVLGLAKVVDDARLFCRTFPDSQSNVVAEKYPSLKVKDAEWTEANIVKRHDATDSFQMGMELYR